MKDRIIQAIDITLKPSLLLLGALSLISILSCLALLSLSMPLFIKLLMMAVVIFTSTYYTLRDALHLLPWSWQRIEVSGLGQLRLTNNSGQQFTPDLGASSFIHPLLIILNVKQPNVSRRLFEPALPAALLFSESGCQQHR
ncbi:MAG: hypothetical protein ACKE5Q_00865, partial [Methylophilaceae bacterium]